MQIRLNMAGRSEELAGESPFSTVEFLDQDSPREACEVRSLDLTAKPTLWRTAVRVAVRELRRFAKFGLSSGEFERLRVTLLNMSQQSIAEGDLSPTTERIEDLMEALAAGHAFLTAEDYYRVLEEEVVDISLEEMNEFIAEMCPHSMWFEPAGPSGMPAAPAPNAIVACAPASISDLNEETLMEALREAGREVVEPEDDIDVPATLMSDEELAVLAQDRNATWKDMRVHPAKMFMLGELSNGVLVNALKSPKRSGRCCMRVACPGGRAIEHRPEVGQIAMGPMPGAVALGAATLQEGGAIGPWSREQVELFCIDNLIGVYVQAEEGALYVDFVFPSETLPFVLQILRGLMTDFKWESDAMARGREALEQRYREVESSLEEYSRATLVNAMTGGDERFATPTSKALDQLTLDSASRSISAHLVSRGVELSIVGDVDLQQLADMLRVYIGTIPKKESSLIQLLPSSITSVGKKGKALRVELPDTDARAVVYVAGEMPSGWGFRADGSHVTLEDGLGKRADRDLLMKSTKARRQHPLFAYVAFGILREVLSRRMFSELREQANLSYEANFKIHSFDNLHGGYYIATATAAPENAQRALEVTKRTLAAFAEGRSRINRSNVDNAKRSVLARYEGGMENDGYIAQTISGLQLPTNPLKTENFLVDLVAVTEAIEVEDIEFIRSTMSFEESQMFSCIGISHGTQQQELGQELSTRLPPRGGSTVLRH